MVSFSTTGLLLHVALFPPGTTHDCAIGQAGPSIWSRLPPAVLHGVPMRVIGLVVVLAVSLALARSLPKRSRHRRCRRLGSFLLPLARTSWLSTRAFGRDARSPGARAELVTTAVADLLRLQVDVIVTGPNPFPTGS